MTKQRLFELALNIREPWFVKNISLNKDENILEIEIDFRRGSRFPCPQCNELSSVHDTVARKWRHLDFFQYRCYLSARVPRVKCKEHKVKQVEVPWATANSGFTYLFESQILQLAMVMAVNEISRHVQETDTRLWRILDRYVEEEFSKKDFSDVRKIGIDEKSKSKGHNYITVVVDLDQSTVIDIEDGKDSSAIDRFSEVLKAHKGVPEKIQEVSCDMSPAFIKGVRENFYFADITFDRFHVMKIINEAIDKVRREEAREHHDLLKNTRYAFLKNPKNLKKKEKEIINKLEDSKLKTVRAYHYKEDFRTFYEIEDMKLAKQYLKQWFWKATHSRLEPIRKAAHTIKNHLKGILRWIESKINNAILEGINSVIQTIKAKARGFRTFKNFRTIILLRFSKLDFTHTK